MDLEKQFVKKESTNPFEICDNFIKEPKNVYIFGRGWKDKFLDSLKLIDSTVCKLEKNEKVENFSFTIIEECINFLNSISIEKESSPSLLEFIRSYIYLAYNLNENLNKYESVRKKISYLQRYCDSALTFTECMNLMKITGERLSRWRRWSPPSFRLSKHYYNTFKQNTDLTKKED